MFHNLLGVDLQTLFLGGINLVAYDFSIFCISDLAFKAEKLQQLNICLNKQYWTIILCTSIARKVAHQYSNIFKMRKEIK